VKRRLYISSIYGDIIGLGKSEISALERFYRRKIPSDSIISFEAARQIASISFSINRQIGVLITRDGRISHVIVGDAKGIFIPSLENYPIGRRPLRGLRLIHTHLKGEPLTKDDLTDLALLRLDMIVALEVAPTGIPDRLYIGYLLPPGAEKQIEIVGPFSIHSLNINFIDFITSLEKEIDRNRVFVQSSEERAILISVSTAPRYEQEEMIEELKELAISGNLVVLDTVIQRPKEINPKYLMGEGKLKETIINALNLGATLLVFNQDLSPSQMKAITDLTEMKVIDRTQLILDIFARRAHSRDGKVQVELAQLKYRLPRLSGKGTAMSRLMGGIGGRGPGEMKLEVDRRRVRDRINLLDRELRSLSEARRQRKQRRAERGIPIVSIIGYTNAGKSTLLNALTESSTIVEQKMFATLDTASRRLRFPQERDVIITDTVGFIRDLPKDLMAAFRATLEELQDAWLLLHIVDISNPRFPQHIESVEKILQELGLSEKPTLLVFNKSDKLPPDEVSNLASRYGAIAISAIEPSTFAPLLKAIEGRIWHEKLVSAKV